MRQFKNNLSILYPEALYLCSSSNEDQTEQDIETMGKNLSKEVIYTKILFLKLKLLFN